MNINTNPTDIDNIVERVRSTYVGELIPEIQL